MNKDPLSSTIERTLSLLEIFIQNPEGLNPQEILDKIQISRSTLFSLLKELKDIGYLDQTESRGRHTAGDPDRAPFSVSMCEQYTVVHLQPAAK